MARPSESFGEPQKREDAMTITATLSAPPDVTGQRHAILAIGSGLAGLTATKALKLSQLNITDALVFVTRFVAQGTSRFVSQASQWTPVIPAVVTLSILAALSVAAFANIAKLIAAQPNHRWTAPSGGQADFGYATTLYGVRDR
jgi:CHASE2 domain-containing sensor protein